MDFDRWSFAIYSLADLGDHGIRSLTQFSSLEFLDTRADMWSSITTYTDPAAEDRLDLRLPAKIKHLSFDVDVSSDTDDIDPKQIQRLIRARGSTLPELIDLSIIAHDRSGRKSLACAYSAERAMCRETENLGFKFRVTSRKCARVGIHTDLHGMPHTAEMDTVRWVEDKYAYQTREPRIWDRILAKYHQLHGGDPDDSRVDPAEMRRLLALADSGELSDATVEEDLSDDEPDDDDVSSISSASIISLDTFEIDDDGDSEDDL
jgi:hypothetical protein